MSMLFFSGVGAIGKQEVSNRKTRRIQRAKKGVRKKEKREIKEKRCISFHRRRCTVVYC